jgi:hypothetical protein
MEIINIIKTSSKNALKLSDILPPPLFLYRREAIRCRTSPKINNLGA